MGGWGVGGRGVGERGRGEKGGGRHLGQHIKAVSVVRMGAFAP